MGAERRLLTLDDLTSRLRGKYISVRWPESGVWYDARVERFDAKTRVAAVYY
ncbi:hypothetical protein BE221DRAFT_56358, partial [Ostreococcus tauri]